MNVCEFCETSMSKTAAAAAATTLLYAHERKRMVTFDPRQSERHCAFEFECMCVCTLQYILLGLSCHSRIYRI